jgi:hypothetical protein
MYSKAIWDIWAKEALQNYEITNEGKHRYKKKGYLHLDNRFWFPEKQEKIKQILEAGLQILNKSTNNNQYYSFSPFLKLLTKTPRYRYQFEEGHYDLETKIRPICYAAHMDSLIIGYYSFALTKIYEQYIKEEEFDDVVLAYRTDLGKCNIQFAKEVFDIVKSQKECSVIALDIKGYFDHIDHIKLLEKWKKVLKTDLPEDQFRIYKILTKYSYVNQGNILKKYKGPKIRGEKLPASLMDIIPGKDINEKFSQLKKDQLIVSNNKPNKKTNRFCGIPQGSPISALLSNVYLVDFDSDLKKKGDCEGFKYRRYCDDILIICKTEQASELMDFIIKKISSEYYLTIQYEKVDLIDFHKNSSGKFRGFRRPRKTTHKQGEKKKVVIKSRPAVTNSLNEEKFYKPLQYLGFEYNGKNIIIRPGSLSRFFRKLNYRLERTVIMSHSPNTQSDQIFLKQIYERYTHLGTRNFLTYAFKAAKKSYDNGDGIKRDGLNSPAIKKQILNHFLLLRHELQKKNEKWFEHKSKGKKKVSPKYFK